jgi:16S rRNA pseudouridine516 synthase
MAKTQRLDKILSNTGYGTRREIKLLLKKGLVKVDGNTIKDASLHIDPYFNLVEINGERLIYKEFIYIMMNKPQGVLSASFDKKTRTVVDLLDDKYKTFEPFPAGRLDKDTEGLLVLTNDGKLAHNILSPKKHVPKTYFAKVEGVVDERDVGSFREGVTLDDGYRTLPADLVIEKNNDISEIYLTICEGKFHQVKRMFTAVGKKVIYLKRVSMGDLKLDESLEPGEYRELTKEEIRLLTMKQGEE